MDSLQDLLAKRSPAQPPEIVAIKKYVLEKFDGRTVGVTLSPDSIIITVNSAAFAGSLRMHIPQLQLAAQTDKRITLRIG